MDSLRRSLEQEKTTSAPRNKGRRRIKGQRELLLPIAGKITKQPVTRVAVDQASIRRLNRHREQ